MAHLVAASFMVSACSTGGSTFEPPTAVPTVATRCITLQQDTAGGPITGDAAATSIARMLVSSAENSSLEWEKQYAYIEYNVEGDDEENRGYTAGIVGFTTRTHDLLALVETYTEQVPDNPLAPFIPALRDVDGTPSGKGLGEAFVRAWRQAAATPAFQRAQREFADETYLDPAVAAAQEDGLGRLGQFVYYDAMVVHGSGDDDRSFGGIRAAAQDEATPPAEGGDEATYLRAFLDARRAAMRAERAHQDTTRVDAQQGFLDAGNLGLRLPLEWSVYGDRYAIAPPGSPGC